MILGFQKKETWREGGGEKIEGLNNSQRNCGMPKGNLLYYKVNP